MAVTVAQVTRITCDGTDLSCSENSNLSYNRPQSVAARLAARLGWTMGPAIICPACTQGHTL